MTDDNDGTTETKQCIMQGSHPDRYGERERRTDQRRVTQFDTVLYILAHHRRRDTLRYLREADQPVSVGELLEHLTEQARSRNVDPPRDIRNRIATDMRHVHLPKLQGAAVIDRDGDTLAYVGDSAFDDVLETVLSRTA